MVAPITDANDIVNQAMLSRGALSIGRTRNAQPARGMATAQQLTQRITSVKNIKKITSAMKMVAACKLRGAQENLDKARAFQKSVNEGACFRVDITHDPS